MTITISLIAADGATGTVTLPNPVVNSTIPPETFFPSNAEPGTLNTNEGAPLTAGLNFQVTVAGTISAIRFYKCTEDTGSHPFALYQQAEAVETLASGTFANESASGWQQFNLATPVNVFPGTTYCVAYFCPTGFDGSDTGYFAQKRYNASGGIFVPVNGGVYNYGSALTFPQTIYAASNYYVDVVFNPATQPPAPPPPPAAGQLIRGVFSPWNPSLNNGAGGDDFNMWGTFVGQPSTAIVDMGQGIAQTGDWNNYVNSAASVCSSLLSDGQPDGMVEMNMGPFPDGVGGTLTQAATGAYVTYWQQAIQKLNGSYQKLRIRLCWEFEGGWYAWGYNNGSQNQSTYATDYIATFRLMVSTIRALMPQARFIFCAADGQTMNSPTWESCYPGDDVVDEIGVDIYCANGRDLTVTDPATLWANEAATGIARSQTLALQHGKDWGVYETAVGSGAVPDNPAWIKSMAQACQTYINYGLNAHLGYWNQQYSGATTGLGGLPNSFAQYQTPMPNGFHV
jgi:hypothetical protein